MKYWIEIKQAGPGPYTKEEIFEKFRPALSSNTPCAPVGLNKWSTIAEIFPDLTQELGLIESPSKSELTEPENPPLNIKKLNLTTNLLIGAGILIRILLFIANKESPVSTITSFLGILLSVTLITAGCVFYCKAKRLPAVLGGLGLLGILGFIILGTLAWVTQKPSKTKGA
jgi:hypothetical protein